jgi:L-ascorbate metabolism protein UlaG (beta-lactamase superfamily)
MTLSLLPIGAYAPRWFMKPVHMNPREAVEASLALRSRLTIPIHYDTFRLADEAFDAPLAELRTALDAVAPGTPGSDFRLLLDGAPLIVAPEAGHSRRDHPSGEG